MKRFVVLFMFLFCICSVHAVAIDIPGYYVYVEQEDGSLRSTDQFTAGDWFDFVVKCDISDDLELYDKYGYFFGLALRTGYEVDAVDWDSIRVFIDGVEIEDVPIVENPSENSGWVKLKYEVLNGIASFYETDWMPEGSILGEENIPDVFPELGWSQWYGYWSWPSWEEFSPGVVVESVFLGDDTYLHEIPVRYTFDTTISVSQALWIYDGLTDEFLDVFYDPSPDWSEEDLYDLVGSPTHDGYEFAGLDVEYRYVDVLGYETSVYVLLFEPIDAEMLYDNDVALADFYFDGDPIGILFYDLTQTARDNGVELTSDSKVEVRFKGRVFGAPGGKPGMFPVCYYFNEDPDNPYDIVSVSAMLSSNPVIPHVEFSTVYLYVDKLDENGELLTGADFDLYKLVDDEWVLLTDVDKKNNLRGGFSFSWLGRGSYKLVESVVPEGYVADDIYFDIDFEFGDEHFNYDLDPPALQTAVDVSLDVKNAKNVEVTMDEETEYWTLQVTNYPETTMPVMPSTGGEGVYFIIFVGVCLLLCGVLYLIKFYRSYF